MVANRLRPICSYQGGKQRIANQVVNALFEFGVNDDTQFYDLCCGSGAIALELVNRGVRPENIWMLDISSWGAFWSAISLGQFDIELFCRLISDIPDDKGHIQAHVERLSKQVIGANEAEIYPILQAASFGGKQILRNGKGWSNTSFRNYWQPTATSVRRSPVNPIQPMAKELQRRVLRVNQAMRGVNVLHADINVIFNHKIQSNSIVYVDPPYENSTGYAFDFDLNLFIDRFRQHFKAPLIVSEGRALNDSALQLRLNGARGGITGSRKRKREEWLSFFCPTH